MLIQSIKFKKYTYILDLILIITESHCKYMKIRKAKPTQNLRSCDIADSFQGAGRGTWQEARPTYAQLSR